MTGHRAEPGLWPGASGQLHEVMEPGEVKAGHAGQAERERGPQAHGNSPEAGVKGASLCERQGGRLGHDVGKGRRSSEAGSQQSAYR